MILKPLRRETKMKNLKKRIKEQTRKNLSNLMRTPRLKTV